MRLAKSRVFRASLAYDLRQFGAEMIVQYQNRWRSFFATLCLVAVVMLYAPYGAAVWAVYAKTCCTSQAQCPVHGHHHARGLAGSEKAMDCGHEMPGMSQCSMSCCQNPDRPAVSSGIFVLPAPVTISLAATSESLTALSGPQSSVNAFEPLSPPPRFASVAV